MGKVVHAVPSQEAANAARVWPSVVVPTAMHLVADGHDTAARTLWDVDTGLVVHVVPFHTSASGTLRFAVFR